MKIALLGYGRMGREIERIAKERGHDIVLKVDKGAVSYDITEADVAIDFSIPSAAVNNIANCLNNHIPVVSGTTGWLEDYDQMVALCESRKGAFIYASNFSLGVNVFFKLNEQLAQMMANLDDYKISLEEIHHTKKLDAPSGTAISLAEGVMKHSNHREWQLNEAKDEQRLPITAKREADVPGTHTVTYTSEIDTIEIKHTAHNRHGFALGAVVAAEWLVGKTGVFTMKDVLNLG